MFVLLEPARPRDFVSGGYRYQDEVMRRLVDRGAEQRAIPPGELDGAIAAIRGGGAIAVVDGLFIEQSGRPLPRDVIALLHMVPSLTTWCDAPVDVIATSELTSAAVDGASRSSTVVRPGLDPAFSPPTDPPANQQLRVLCVGTVCRAKGQHLVATAASRAHAAANPIELVCIGDLGETDFVDELHAAVGQAPLRLPGNLPPAAVAREMQRADIFVSASRSESFGMAAAEAAACGLPMIAFETGAITGLSTHQDHLLPPDASDAAMIEALTTAFSQGRPPRANARRALDNWNIVADRFATAVRSCKPGS